MEEDNTNKLLGLIITQLGSLEEKIENIRNNMVTKDDCQGNQNNCLNQFKLKKNEMTVARLAGYSGIVTAACAGIAGIIKLFIS